MIRLHFTDNHSGEASWEADGLETVGVSPLCPACGSYDMVAYCDVCSTEMVAVTKYKLEGRVPRWATK